MKNSLFLVFIASLVLLGIYISKPHYQKFKPDSQCQQAWLLEEFPKSWEKMPSLKNKWSGGGMWNRVLTQEEISFLANN